MKRVVVGMIGTGFAAEMHVAVYRKIYGVEVVLKAVASLAPDAKEFARKAGIGQVYDDYHMLLQDPEIDVIDIVTPPCLHAQMAADTLRSKKHVICEKPLTGFFESRDFEEVGKVPKRQMYEEVHEKAERLKKEVEDSGCLFMYAENYIYTPSLQKCVEFLKAKKSKILFIRAEESHRGSHAGHAAYWKYNGGGSLIRQGCHPLSAVLYIKEQEAKARGEEIKVSAVMADMGRTGAILNQEEHQYIDSHAVDVEDIANMILTFSDGTKAVVMAGDMVVGGVKNLVEVYTNEGVYYCNMAANDGLRVYHENDKGMENIYVTEKIGNKTGWQNIFLEEPLMRGYIGEMQDFIECIAFNRKPHSDYGIAAKTIEVIYAAYCSAQEGRRLELDL